MSHCHNVTKCLYLIHNIGYVLFILFMLCRFVLLTFLHGWPSTEGDDIHFQPKSWNLPMRVTDRSLKLSITKKQQKLWWHCMFLLFRCLCQFCLFTKITMAPRVTRWTVPSNSVSSFEAKDAFENENVKRPVTQPGWSKISMDCHDMMVLVTAWLFLFPWR